MESKLTTQTRLLRIVVLAIVAGLMLILPPNAPAGADSGANPTGLQPEADPLVRCEPASVTATVGQTAVIDLYVQDVTNLYGLDLRVSFDPTIGQVVDQDPAPGTQIQILYSFLSPGFVLHRDVNAPSAIPPNCGVWCIWYAATQLNPTPPANGSGPVARVTFQGLQAGTFPMNWINTQLSAPGGVPILPVNSQPCSVTFTPPLAVVLESLEASAQVDHILVNWTTVSEVDNAGFNLYRSTEPSAPAERLNAALIPSRAPGGGQGASYQWQDFDIEAGVTYYYWLETVAFSGATALHGPTSATVQVPTAVALGSMNAGPAAGTPALSWLLVVAGALAALVLVRRQ